MASAELRIINRRIKSVKSTKKITRAMELIASSRIVKAQQRLTSSNNYTNLLAQIVEELTGSGEMPTSPAIEGTKKITLVVITSDRGLAGAYNTNILKLAEIHKHDLTLFIFPSKRYFRTFVPCSSSVFIHCSTLGHCF